ncbi:hypothetical protein SAMN05660653_02097 [Desulfonatronum thiosulfatophilum]|uniref:Uracil DNA glycosylase superfamily protein n=1 Tax=Desulfonatronum thiosulfatophilum TaxID=617002 RepID=A0A1G6DE07_9BACT|nr:hypothetical protein [Desulfonatronum thiosulfatophilum]SDB43376.1 hypothetical protein SAMN05660653_02097 [Desulfonatronum thiosulfatophilum]
MLVQREKFKDWSCSLSGCDGGDPEKAKIWFCGIEWGYSKKDATEFEKIEYYTEKLPQEINEGTYRPENNYPWKESLRYSYGRNIAKLYSVIETGDINNYIKTIDGLNGSEIFKLNLYPIPFNNTSEELWIKYKLNETTGFENKNIYKTWCYMNRFPNIAKLTDEYKPKIVIGTGLSYFNDFFVCFSGYEKYNMMINYGILKSKDSERKVCYYWSKINTNTTLFVIPFFSSQYGLNSDYLIEEMGKNIREKSISFNT